MTKSDKKYGFLSIGMIVLIIALIFNGVKGHIEYRNYIKSVCPSGEIILIGGGSRGSTFPSAFVCKENNLGIYR